MTTTQQYTPMMQQYLSLKEKHPDTILLFRLGDFYEMFFEDANKASQILEITLTAREAGKNVKVPMCGVPFHAVDGYINRLIKAGLKVAICEQTEDPKFAKGLVKRDLTRIITPSTHMDENIIGSKSCNFLVSICKKDCTFGMATIEPTTGDFLLSEHKNTENVINELARLNPKEVILPNDESTDYSRIEEFLLQTTKPNIVKYDEWIFDTENAKSLLKKYFHVDSIEGFGIENTNVSLKPTAAIFYYLRENLHTEFQHIKPPKLNTNSQYMILDSTTVKNLELINSTSNNAKDLTLINTLDQTITPMGARLLREWLTQPLIDIQKINERFDMVTELIQNSKKLHELSELLKPIKDISRIVTKINNVLSNARDILNLKLSLQQIPAIKNMLKGLSSTLANYLEKNLIELESLVNLIQITIEDEPPISLKDGGIIKKGYHKELDELRDISKNAKIWVGELQDSEIKRTGIKSLKVRYNRVFGYYIEISNSNLNNVPADYIRKQTLVNAERFITPKLKEYEEKILTAQERSNDIEFQIFQSICEEIKKHMQTIQQISQAVATLDVLVSFANTSTKYNYTRPVVDNSETIFIESARHPVIERLLLSGEFVENDLLLDSNKNQLLLITGPNMAGKSTYIRQTALLVLMAQMGCFIPAKKAHIGITDRIFTRIGASDNLTQGQSTFMVEMVETANILNNATSRSLVILDEIGRGTSTFDGLSIAWAVTEFLTNPSGIRPRTLFATHYHELTELESIIQGVKNLHIAVKEWKDKIIFLRKIVEGGTDKSYGIHVAELAGIPKEVIKRANQILKDIEKDKIKIDGSPNSQTLSQNKNKNTEQLLIDFEKQNLINESIIEKIKSLDPNKLTPLEALGIIQELKEKLQS